MSAGRSEPLKLLAWVGLGIALLASAARSSDSRDPFTRLPRLKPPFSPPKRPRRGDGRLADGVPVDPSRPGSFDGGAAAALEFDE